MARRDAMSSTTPELRRLNGVIYDLQQRLNASELRVAQFERGGLS